MRVTKTVTTIVTKEVQIYEPNFDENRDKYYDKSTLELWPDYVSHQRNRVHFICGCSLTEEINNESKWVKHKQKNKHKHYIDNYKMFNRPLVDAKGDNKRLEILNRKKDNALRQLLNKIKEYKASLSLQDSIQNRVDELEKMLVVKERRIASLKRSLNSSRKSRDVGCFVDEPRYDTKSDINTMLEELDINAECLG